MKIIENCPLKGAEVEIVRASTLHMVLRFIENFNEYVKGEEVCIVNGRVIKMINGRVVWPVEDP